MSAIIYNGTILSNTAPCISHADRGFTLGHGLFETLFIPNNTIPAFDYHWRRLEKSAPLIGIALPFSKDALATMLKTLVAHNQLCDTTAGARITISHGESERGMYPNRTPTPNYVITVFPYTRRTHSHYTAVIAKNRKNEHSVTARVKSISYLDNILAKKEALQKGYDEAILLNTASHVADASMANVFLVQKTQIHTPPITDGALPGVIRSILLETFQQHFTIVERSITQEDLLNADEVFLTNALMGVQPISRINDKTYDAFSTGHAILETLQPKLGS